jgi:hypothetical protein
LGGNTSTIVGNNVDQSHRRLLWQQPQWGDMRAEAINSIFGYFGSVSAGSVGWCVGTELLKHTVNRKSDFYDCGKKSPSNQIPWMQKGGLGHDQC